MDEPIKKPLAFGFKTDTPRIIKVVGVGGGGSNAVHNMYRKGIQNVSFAVCNIITFQALDQRLSAA